jgi:hypothetical protein
LAEGAQLTALRNGAARQRTPGNGFQQGARCDGRAEHHADNGLGLQATALLDLPDEQRADQQRRGCTEERMNAEQEGETPA